MRIKDQNGVPPGMITFERRGNDITFPDWQTDNFELDFSNVEVKGEGNSIEEQDYTLQAIFAHKIGRNNKTLKIFQILFNI